MTPTQPTATTTEVSEAMVERIDDLITSTYERDGDGYYDTPLTILLRDIRAALADGVPVMVLVPRAWEKLQLWFFRDMSYEQRLALFSIFGMPVDEIGKVHGHQRRALKHIVNALSASTAGGGK